MLEAETIKKLENMGYIIICDYNSGQILVSKNKQAKMLTHEEARKMTHHNRSGEDV